jgi:hypothetical protein
MSSPGRLDGTRKIHGRPDAVGVAARPADFSLLHGTTASGTPATLFHRRRYSLVLSLICAAIRVSAQFSLRS